MVVAFLKENGLLSN